MGYEAELHGQARRARRRRGVPERCPSPQFSQSGRGARGNTIGDQPGWLCALFLSEMLTASAMQGYEGELEKAIVLTLFIPLIMSSGGNSGSQATSLLAAGVNRAPSPPIVRMHRHRQP